MDLSVTFFNFFGNDFRYQCGCPNVKSRQCTSSDRLHRAGRKICLFQIKTQIDLTECGLFNSICGLLDFI